MDLPAVEQYLHGLQRSICDQLSAIDGAAEFETETWDRPEGGGGVSRVLVDGNVFEKGEKRRAAEIHLDEMQRL